MNFNYAFGANYNRPLTPIRDPDDVIGFDVDATAKPNLKYRGGKVLKNPSIVTLYYGSFWSTTSGKKASSYENDFAKFIGQSEYTSVWSEYGVERSSFAGSVTVNATSVKSVSDSKIKQIVAKQIASGLVPKPDGNTVYTVFLPPNAVLKAPGNISSRDGLGGYHGSFDLKGNRVYYAAIVYSKADNGIDFNGSALDNISITASHEWIEAATDPDVNNGKLGWYDNNLGEIADIPINQGMTLDKVYGRLGRYAVQKIWSNKDGRNEITAR